MAGDVHGYGGVYRKRVEGSRVVVSKLVGGLFFRTILRVIVGIVSAHKVI